MCSSDLEAELGYLGAFPLSCFSVDNKDLVLPDPLHDNLPLLRDGKFRGVSEQTGDFVLHKTASLRFFQTRSAHSTLPSNLSCRPQGMCNTPRPIGEPLFLKEKGITFDCFRRVEPGTRRYP